ncbi:hypothetical protein BJY52DRAFT_1230249 [Lactarius psammicola]|nr:hypothetical protein BJY52DRAFT_1230249 [Lactarius psammicola]
MTTDRKQTEHHSTARTRPRTGLPLQPCPAFLFSDLTSAMGAAGPATEIATQQRARRCQRHPNAAHPCESTKAVGEGRPKVVRGRRQRRRYGATTHDLQRGDEDCRVETENKRSITPRPELDQGQACHSSPAPFPLLRPDIRNGAKSGLTAYRRRVLTVAHKGAAGPATEIATRNARAGEGRPKVVRGRRRRRRYGATTHDLQPGDEDCRVEENDGTHLNDNRQKNVWSIAPRPELDRPGQACHSSPAPLSSSPPDIRNGAKSGLTAYRRRGAAGPATEIATQQRARRCQRHPNRLTSLDSAKASTATENEARQACESESLRRQSDESHVPPGGGEATSTPTEATRRHANVARGGYRAESSTGLEDQGHPARGKGNERSHRGNQDGTSRLPAKGAVRRG